MLLSCQYANCMFALQEVSLAYLEWFPKVQIEQPADDHILPKYFHQNEFLLALLCFTPKTCKLQCLEIKRTCTRGNQVNDFADVQLLLMFPHYKVKA